jgi:hypothetical protein
MVSIVSTDLSIYRFRASKHQEQRRRAEDWPVQILGPSRADAVLDASLSLSGVADLGDDLDAGIAWKERVDKVHAGVRLVIVLEMELTSHADTRFGVATRAQLNHTDPLTQFIK